MPKIELDKKKPIQVAIIIGVEEPSLLITVDRIIGRIKIKDDLVRCSVVRLQKQVDQKSLDRHWIVRDLVITRRLQPAQLESVERRLPSGRCAILAPCLEFSGQHRHQRIVAQLVMVVEILITQRDSEYPLTNQGHDLVLDEILTPFVVKAPGKPIHHLDRAIRRAQKQRSRIRHDRTRIERRYHLASFNGFKSEKIWGTLCRHRGVP